MKRTIFGILLMASFFLLTISCKEEDCFTSDRCQLEPQVGPCNAAFSKYYYDKTEKKCKVFIWGGCEGVVPFDSLEECENKCHCKWRIIILILGNDETSLYDLTHNVDALCPAQRNLCLASFRNSDNRIIIQQFNIVYSCVFVITSFDIPAYEINIFTNAFSAMPARGAEISIS